MLNRRYLRIKVMQGLYIYFQSHNNDVLRGENELLRSIDRIYDLYLLLLQFLSELRMVAVNSADDRKLKKLPTSEDLDPNLRFINNAILLQLEENLALGRGLKERKIGWSTNTELIRRTFTLIRSGKEYEEYMSTPKISFEADLDFIIFIFKKYVADSDQLESYLEEQSIYWANDLNLAVAPMILKTLESLKPTTGKDLPLLPLFKDADEDKQFVLDLYRKTITHDKECEKMISEKTRNWEIDRIAMMDVLLMKMAITELMHFQNVPVKVSLNEYIEISKLYSTPQSKLFINGILDKLVADLKEKELVNKTGRGLME